MVGKPKSCTACRQAKTACDVRNTAPSCCSRCNSRNLECRLDKGFKRVSTRRIAQDIAYKTLFIRPTQNPSEDRQLPAQDGEKTLAEANDYPVFLLSDDLEGSQDFSLGDLSISAQTAVELLHHFEYHYLPHARFLHPINSLNNFAALFPLLFWTLILVASERHAEYSNLYQQLFIPHRELLAPLSSTAVQSVEEIHAILLLCLWPIPKRQLLHDPAYNYIGIAASASLRLNLHKPTPQDHIIKVRANWPYSVEYVSVKAQYLTWLACFSISTHVATFMGFVPPLSSHHQIKHVKKAIEQLDRLIRPEDRASLAICEAICNFSILLEEIEDTLAHFSLTRTFISNVDNIKQSYSAHWTPELDIQSQYVKLQFYAVATFPPLQDPFQENFQNDADRESLLFSGLQSACSLINNMKDISLRATVDGQYHAGRLTFYPRYFFTNLFFSAIFLFRILIENRPIVQEHRPLAIQGISTAHELFRLVPCDRDVARATRLLQEVLNKIGSSEAWPDNLSSSQLIITNRLGASLLWDTIFRLRLRGRGNDTSRPQSVEQIQMRREIRNNTLPLAPEMRAQLPNAQTQTPTVSFAEDLTLPDLFFWDAYMDNPGLELGQEIFPTP